MNKLLFTLCFIVCSLFILKAQPLNDDCINATPIVLPASGSVCITGNNIGATSTAWGAPICGQANWTNDVWYTFITNGNINTITVRPTGSPAAQTVAVAAFTGNCGALTGNSSYCDIGSTPTDSAYVTQSLPTGTQVWLEVSAFGANGNFQICITSSTPPPAPGTSCATATNVCDLSNFTLGSTTLSGGFTPNCFTGTAGASVWYAFTPGTSGSLQWSATPTNPSTELDWAVYNITSGCAAPVTLCCNYNYNFSSGSTIGMSPTGTGACGTTAAGGATGEMSQPINVVAGQTYAILIDNFDVNNSGWNFSWAGSTFQMAPTSSFTASPGTFCGNSGTTTIVNNSIGATSWSWNFGDGTTSNVQNPGTHTYNTPGTYLISLTVTSATGCTDVSSQSIQITPNPTLSVNSATVCAGAPATLTATAVPSGGTYLWSNGLGTNSTASVSPGSTTTYTVTYTSTVGCTVSASSTVTVATANFTVDAGTNTTICANQTAQLTGTVNPAGSYTYSWSPSGTLTGANTLTPQANPLLTTTYTLSVTDAGGCTQRDSVIVTVSGTGPPVVATVTPTSVCPGQPVQLDFTATPINCGINRYGCGGTDQIDSLGTGYTVQTGSPTANATLYGNQVKSQRWQILYTAAEINAIYGAGGGTIKALAWEVGTFNSNAGLQNFTIKMGCVSPAMTTISNWEPNLKQVYTIPVYQPITGWNNHNLDSTYDWDGVSNIVVEICFYNPSTSGSFNNMMVYTTVNNSAIYAKGNTDQCSTSPVATSTNQRPKMRMRMCRPNYNSFTISWTPSTGPNAVSNASIKNPTANVWSTQNFTVNVSNGTCSGSDIVTVSIDTSVKVNAGPDKTFCANTAVALNATPTGSPQPGNSFAYTWTKMPAGTVVGNTQAINVNPTANTTYVVAMTGGLCTVTDTVNVTLVNMTVSHTATNVNCNGGNTGKIKETAVGNAPYTFAWSANAATGNVDSAVNLIAGTYYVTVTDALGCIGKDTIVITQPTAVSFTGTPTNVSCNGDNNGSITITPAGGTGAYSYAWSGGLPSTQTVSNLTAGNYSVTLSDALSCSASGTFSITEPTALALNPTVFKDIRCFNGNDGFITVSPTGGTSPYHYSWSQNAGLNQPNATNLTAGTYTVSVYDNNNCSLTFTKTLTQPANGLSFNAPTITNVSCFGGNNGSATVNPTGGATPYVYAWSNGAGNTPTANSLIANTYYASVTDDSLCTAIDTIIITQPAQIGITGTTTNISCNAGSNGAIDITVTNAQGAPTYNWNNNAYTTEDLSGVPAGTYNITVTDASSCTQTATFTLTQPAALTLNAPNLTNISCFGGNNGSITANPAGGTGSYSYSWSPGSGNAQTYGSLIAGNYNVVVTDANSCTVSAAYSVTEPATALVITNAAVVNLQCNGGTTGSITITATGGTGAYTYSWSHNLSLNNAQASGLSAGSYSVSITDANACSVSGSYTITQPSAIVFGGANVTDVSCANSTDGVATVNFAGGTGTFTYTWNGNPGGATQNNLAAGNYTVVATDGNGCSASGLVFVNAPLALHSNPTGQDALCFGASNGVVDANPSGGTPPYTFLWSSGDATQVAATVPAGFYSVTVTDSRNCSVTGSINVNEPSNLTALPTTTPVKCQGDKNGTITATMNGGTPPYSYSVTSDGVNFVFPDVDGTVHNLAPGTYTVLYSDNNGCTKTTTATVVDAVPDVFTMSTDSTSCYGATYNDGAIHINGLTIQNMPYQFSVDGGPFQYSGDFYNLKAGIHQITTKNYWDCTTTVQAIIPEPAEGVADILPGDTTLQLGESVQFTSTFSPYSTSVINSYNWSPSTGLSCIDCPNPVLNPYNRVTDFVLTITYNDHCTATATVRVLVENGLPVYIPNAFTPNGDGNNDIFLIYGEGIKTVDLKVFNRWGELVFDSNNQFNGWDGSYKGVMQNNAVYSYVANITYLDGKKVQRIGSITLVR
ncbi:MAG: gliding motility-associated C-terminal domain-containing protein [Chitinophagales bacterium]